jgi:hypothetical protein
MTHVQHFLNKHLYRIFVQMAKFKERVNTSILDSQVCIKSDAQSEHTDTDA